MRIRGTTLGMADEPASWPTDLTARLRQINRHGLDGDQVRRLVDDLMADCEPMIHDMAEKHCHDIDRSDVIDVAIKAAITDVRELISAGVVPAFPTDHLRAVIRNAVNRATSKSTR